jgi:hypothetical protein
VVSAPLALVLYGVCIQHGLHWMVATVGLGLLSFSIVNATNAAMVYAVDVYKPVAGEVVTTILAFKAIWGFALSYGTNTWIATEGYQNGESLRAVGWDVVSVSDFQTRNSLRRDGCYLWRGLAIYHPSLSIRCPHPCFQLQVEVDALDRLER